MEGKGVKILIAILVILIIVAGGVLAYKITEDKNQVTEENQTESTEKNVLTAEVKPKEVQIYQGNDRPIAVMIDNHNGAWPQAGLNQAYMVYEIIVEGGETRLMALFKGVNLDKIGPVRSARHYFLDYAMENDAIYVHFGQSPQAESDITRFSIHDINGISEDGTTFWRVRDKYSPHNAVTNTEKILQSAKNKNYRTTSTNESVLNYLTDEVNLEDGESAETITIPHSQLQTVRYEYDSENKVYVRYARNTKISETLVDLGLVKELNEGVSRIYEEMAKFFLDEPEYVYEEGDILKLTLKNNIVMRDKRISETLQKKLNIKEDWEKLPAFERNIIRYISDKGEAGTTELIKYTGRSKNTVLNVLKKLEELQIIEWVGTNINDPKKRYILKQ